MWKPHTTINTHPPPPKNKITTATATIGNALGPEAADAEARRGIVGVHPVRIRGAGVHKLVFHVGRGW